MDREEMQDGNEGTKRDKRRDDRKSDGTEGQERDDRRK